jgi:hypothetical protein
MYEQREGVEQVTININIVWPFVKTILGET